MKHTRLHLVLTHFLIPWLSTLTLAFASTEQIESSGPHHRNILHISRIQDPSSGSKFWTNRYVELADGLNYQSKPGLWSASTPTFRITNGWAFANDCQHKAAVCLQSRRIGGIILTQPDGSQLRSHLVGLSYFDSATGQSVLLAEPQDRRATLVHPSQVLFQDAFDDVDADVRYTMSLQGFEQDVIFRRPPPPPSEFGLNPESTRLEVLTEFIQSPEPRISRRSRANQSSPKLQDEEEEEDQTLEFGSMTAGAGRVFEEHSTNAPLASVNKRWMRLNQRPFLVESVPYSQIVHSLRALDPDAGASIPHQSPQRAFNPSSKPTARTEFQRPVPSSTDWQAAATTDSESFPDPIPNALVANQNTRANGVVIDYLLTLPVSSSPMRFRADTTYYISGNTTISGATFEGGTVLKYAPGASLVVDTAVTEETSSIRPVIFTAATDDSVGEPIQLGSSTFPRPSPSGTFGAPCLWIKGAGSGSAYPCTLDASNFLFAHASTGLRLQGGPNHILRNSQFRECATAIELIGSMGQTLNASILNGLIVRCTNVVTASGALVNITAQHLTIGSSHKLRNGIPTGVFDLRNSLLVAVGDISGVDLGTNKGNAMGGSLPGDFSQSGIGAYYLPTGSPHLDACTTNSLDPQLVADLATRTTRPPTLLEGTISGTRTLSPIPHPEKIRNRLDRGFHYPSLDFILSNLRIVQGQLRVSPGCALGIFGSTGIVLGPMGSLITSGSPNAPISITRLQSIQERSSPTAQIPGSTLLRTRDESLIQSESTASDSTELSSSYTIFTVPSGTGALIGGSTPLGKVHLKHCQLFGGTIAFEVPSTNRCTVSMEDVLLQGTQLRLASFSNSLTAKIHRSSIRTSRIALGSSPTDSWELGDSILNEVDLTYSNTGISWFNNAFCRATNLTTTGQRTLISLAAMPGTNSLVLGGIQWAKGPVGYSYYTTSTLRDRGSSTAPQAGLFHHTTSPTQSKELTSLVDLGYHAPVLSNGSPIDTDSDGLSDLEEDLDGNGLLADAPPNPEVVMVETSFTSRDTDADGVSDSDERLKATNPRRPDLLPESMVTEWNFNQPNFATTSGDPAWIGSMATRDPRSWDGDAALISVIPASGTIPTQYQFLAYPWMRSNGQTLLPPETGTLQFWFKPNWSSRTNGIPEDGITTPRKLISIQAPGDETEYWSLQLNSTGNLATFSTLRSGSTTPRSTSWNIQFERGVWNQVTLTFGHSGVELWKNTQRLQPVTATLGTEPWPRSQPQLKQLFIGGWSTPSLPRTANGSFEAVRSFNYILKPETIQRNHSTIGKLDSDGDGLPDVLEFQLSGFSASQSDSDSDGLPDSWEYDFFHSNTGQPLSDPDSDGVNNLQEFIQGRNPLIKDTSWSLETIRQTVRTPSDLINIDFVTLPRFSQTGERTKFYDQTQIRPVVASMATDSWSPNPKEDLWNILTPEQFSHGETLGPSTPIKNAAGGVTQLRLSAVYGPIQKWSSDECAQTIADILADRRPSSYPDFPDFGIPITRPSLPPIPIATTVEGWCRPAFPPAPIQPNQISSLMTLTNPFDGWQPPESWWSGSQVFQFQAACGGPVGGSRILAVSSPRSPGTGVSRDGEYDALKSLSDYPPCTGTILQFLRPAFQSGSEFANSASDWSSGSVTTHPMLLDYLTTTEESPAWRSFLESNGFDLSDAHSRLQISGIQPGPWRVLVYSASENDQRSCPIVLQPATSTFIPFVNVPSWVPGELDPLVPISDFSSDRIVTSIQPGVRHTTDWIAHRHYVQTTLDISSDGVLNLQFIRNAALNGIQLVRLRPLESPQWTSPLQSNSSSGVILRWNPVPTADHYSVQRAENPDGPWTDLITDLHAPAHRDPTAIPNSNGQPRSYWYRIQAFNERFQSTSEAAIASVSTQFIANRPPVLSRFQPLGPAFQGQSFPIGIEDLRTSAIASDFDNDGLEFRVERILAGTLSIDGMPITDSQLQARTATNALANLVRNGSRVQWFPSIDLPGIVPAIELRAFDGTHFSDQSAVLPIIVKAPNQVVWWGSNLSETAGNGQSVDDVSLETKYPGRRRYIRSDPEYWSSSPTPVSGPDNGQLRNVIQLAAKTDVSVALKGDGTVWSWGRGDARLGLGSPGCPPLQPNCELPWFAPGSVVSPRPIQFPPESGNLRQVALGSAHAAALSKDGLVYLWGATARLAEGMFDGPTAVLDILPASSLRTATTVEAYDPTKPEERENAQRFAALGTGIPTLVPNLYNVRQITCSDHAIAVLTHDGIVLDWGTLSYLDTREIRFGPGGAITTLGGHRRILNSATPTPRAFPSKPIHIAAAANIFFATLESGEVYAWGANDSGGFADPSWPYDITDPLSVGTLTPRRVLGLTRIQSVSASDSYALALSRSGTVFEWGRNLITGQPIQPPRPLLGLPKIESISVTTSTAFAMDHQGHAWAWGHNGDFGSTPEYSSLSGLIDPRSREDGIVTPHPLDFLPAAFGTSAPNASSFHAIASLLPSSPQQVMASASGNSIRLTWKAFPGANLYHVYRSLSPGSPFELHRSVPNSQNLIQELVDSSIANGIHYYYRITAVVAFAETDPSTLVWARVQSVPGQISSFALTAKSRSIQLSWCADTNAQSYEIQRAGPLPNATTLPTQADFKTQYHLKAAELYSQLQGTPDCSTNKLKFTDSELETGRWYTYRIRAINESGQGLFVEARQSPQPSTFGPTPPSITGIHQNNTTAVIQFQTNHPPQDTQWVVHLYHHKSLTPSAACLIGSSPVEPDSDDPGWILDRSVVLPDTQGAYLNKMALSLAPSSSRRALLIDAIPSGVWHKVVILAETQAGLSGELQGDPSNSKVFRTLNPATVPIELLTATSGAGYIYVRYRNEAGFAPTVLNPSPLPCNSAAAPLFDPNYCLSFSEFPWSDSGETESWILNLPALPSPTQYQLQITPGASSDTALGIDLEFDVQERRGSSFPIKTTVADSRIRLEWYSPEWSATFANRKFIVERIAAAENGGALPNACDPAVRWTLRAEGSGFQFEENLLENGLAYQYRVIALHPETGELDWQTTPPLVPAKMVTESERSSFALSLRAIPHNGAIELQWDSIASQRSPQPNTVYSLYHFASTNLPGDRIAQYSNGESVSPMSWRHFHQPIANGTTHFYQIIAAIDDLTEISTALVGATPTALSPPLSPGRIAIREIRTPSSPIRYILDWDPTEGARAYQIRYRAKGSTNCLGQSIVGRTQTEIESPSSASSPNLEFSITAIGTGGLESESIPCGSTRFLSPTLFGPITPNSQRLSADEVEFIDLVIPPSSIGGIPRVYTPTNITLRASVAFSGREVKNVEFYSNDQLIGESSSHPYAFDWVNPPSDSNRPLRLVAIVTLSDGSRRSSPERQLEVRVRPPLSGFTHTMQDFSLKAGSESFEIQHTYKSQDSSDGILGRGWKFNFEQAQLLRPNLSTGWRVVGTGLANLFATVQETNPSHEIQVTLPDGTPLRFAVSVNFTSTHTQHEIQWLQFTGDPDEDLGTVRVEFISVDGSGAVLKAVDSPEFASLTLGDTAFQDGHQLVNGILRSQDLPFAPKHFIVRLPSGWSYEFRAPPSANDTGLINLRIHQIQSPHGGTFRFVTRRVDGTEAIGASFGHIDTKRISIEALSPHGVLIRDCWLDRLSGPVVTWALYDPVAIQRAKAAQSTNMQALSPGSVATPPVLRIERNGNRVEAVSQLISRTGTTYHTHRYGYSIVPGNSTQGIPSQDLLTSITAPNGTVALQNQYQLRDGLFCLVSQQDIRGVTRSFGYGEPSRVIATTASATGEGFTESIAFTSNGESSEFIDATGIRTVYTRDDRGRIVFEAKANSDASQPILPTAAFRYDDRDNPVETTDALGNTSRKEFDPQGRIVAESDANQNSAHYIYSEKANLDGSNPIGTLTSALDAEGNSTEFRYNARGQITAMLRRLTDTSAVSITRYEYHEVNSSLGRIGDLRRVYEPLSIVCQSLDHPLPTSLPTYASEYSYDDNGNIQALSKIRTIRTIQTNALGAPVEGLAYELTATKTTHDPANRQIESSQHRWQLDTSYNVQPSSESVLQRRGSMYDHAGREIQTTDYLGRSVYSLYDLQGNLIQVLYPDGTVQRTLVDSLGRRSLVQDRSRPSGTSTASIPASGDTTGPATEYVYDSAGRTLFTKQRSNVQLRLQSVTNYPGYASANPNQFICVNATPASVWTTNAHAIHRFVHDASGRLRYQVNPEGGLMETVYDNASRATSILRYEDKVFPLDQTPIDTTNARSLATRHGYDGVGNRIWSVEPSSTNLGGHRLDDTQRIEYQYDRLNRLTTTLLPLHRGIRPSERVQYDALGNKAVVTDPNGVSTRYAYDLHGRLISIVLDWNPSVPETAQAHQTRYEYDEFGNLIAQIDAEGRRTRYEYDALGRRRNRILPGGNLLSSPASGDMESTEFASIPAPNGPTGLSVLQRTTQSPGGGILVSQFDSLDRPTLLVTRTSATAPVESTIRFEYTDWGTPARILEFRGNPLPTTPTRTTEYGYHVGTRRLESKSSPEGRILYQHNRAQQVTRMAATLGTTFLTGSLYEYDPMGRLIGVRRLSSTSDVLGSSMARHKYGLSGQVESTDLGNGVLTRKEYNSRNHLSRIVHHIRGTSTSPQIASFDYDSSEVPLDGNGTRYSVLESFTGFSSSLTWSSTSQRGRRLNYSYDRLGRLSREEAQYNPAVPGSMLGTPGFVTYSLDKVGNRLSRLPSSSLLSITPTQGPSRYDLQDHPDPDTTPNTRSPWVDLAGNTSQIPVSPTTAIPSGDTYDTLGRIVAHRQSGSAIYWSYGYDERGNRISRRTQGSSTNSETRFLIDERSPSGFPQVIAEWRTEGGLTNIVRTYQVGTELICQEDGPSGTNRRYFLADALGSTRVLADNSGYPRHLFHYDAFGRVLGRLDWNFSGTSGGAWVLAASPLSGLPTQHLFAGESWDSDLQLSYHRARYYSPNLGRFWTPDTYEGNQTRPQSLHRYAYGEGNPVNLLDPSGHASLGDALTSIAARATMAARSTGPIATGVRTALAVLTIASAAHDPAAFVASFESPNAAMGVLAADAGFVLYYTKRAVNFATGFIAARMEIRPAVEGVLSQSAQRLQQLDPDALVGFRGSVARGYKGPHKGNDPFDPNNFDVDGFVVSDKLAAKIPKIRGARFANAQNSPELAAEQKRVDGELRSKLTGLKDDDFTFRVFTYQEYFKKFKDGKLIEE